MIRLTYIVTLIIAMASWAALGSPHKGSDFAVASSAILPPLPDLPIPGSKTKVIGNQSTEAVQPRKEERAVQNTDTQVETSSDSASSPIVFKTDRAQQLVF
jgi:hypothetical protein